MPRLYHAQTGKPVDISDVEAPALLASGKFGFAGDQVALVAPGGRIAGFRADDPRILQALEAGFRIETPEEGRQRIIEAQYGDRDIAAGLAGAARGLTFGLSDAVLAKLGLVERETLAGLKEANPIASGVGEGVAIGATILAPGAGLGALGKALRSAGTATRAVAKGGQAIERTVVGALAKPGASPLTQALVKGTGAGAAGIVEGALYSTGQLVSEHALGDTELNAERILAHIGAGAALGGAAGAAIGAALPMLGAATDKVRTSVEKRLGEGGLAGKVDAAASQFAGDSFGLTGVNIRRLQRAFNNDEALQEIASEVRKFRFEDGSQIISPKLSGSTAEELTERLGRAVEEQGKKIGRIIKQADAANRKVGRSIDLGRFFARVDDEIIKPLSGADLQSIRNTADKLADELAPLRKKADDGAQLSLKEAWSMRRVFDRVIYGTPNAGKGVRLAPEHAAEMLQARGILEDIITEEVEKSAPVLGDSTASSYRDIKQSFRKLRALHDEAVRRQAIIQGNRRISLTDYLNADIGATIGAAFGGPSGVFGALVGSQVNRFIRTRGMPILATLTDKAARMMAVEQAIKSSDEVATEAADGLARAIMQGSRANGAADAPVRADEIIRNAEALRRLAANTDAIAEQVTIATSNLGDVAPALSASISAKLTQAVIWLASKAPEPLLAGDTLTPDASEPTYVREDVEKFARYVRAYKSPYSVLHDIAAGDMNTEGMEVLRTLYPLIYQRAVQAIVAKMATRKEPLPYNERVRLAYLFGLPADPTLRPEFFSSMQQIAQQSTAAAAAAKQQMAGGFDVRTAGIKELEVFGAQAQTNSQRILGGQ